MNRKSLVYFFMIALFAMVSCNSSDTEEYEEYVLPSDVAITSFTISANDDLLENLDSVYFTIDLENRRIFNADSLPKGTDVSRLVVNITYPLVQSIKLKVTGGKVMEDEEIDYYQQSTDSIDFTGNVALELVSADGSTTATYDIKVNVHQMDPDSLYWNSTSRRDLPALNSPLAQKTVMMADKLFCLIKEASQYVISSTSDIENDDWTTEVLQLPFTPVVNSFTSTDDALYLLSDSNELYKSADGINWASTGKQFESLICGYEEYLLGVVLDGSKYVCDMYPRRDGFLPFEAESDFPVYGTSNAIRIENVWSVTPQYIVLGGIDASGRKTGACWGFDGSTWGKISNRCMPAVSGATIVSYTTYTVKDNWKTDEYVTWLAFGGRESDDSMRDSVYISYDNGMNWMKGGDLIQLPEYIPAFDNAQAFVISHHLTARTSSGTGSAWTSYPSRRLPAWYHIVKPASTRGIEYEWDCPYIYLFGGEDANGVLSNSIWKGVINRLSFKPII